MPVLRDEGGSEDFQTLFGVPAPPPPSPSAPPTANAGSPVVSSTPTPGGGVATDLAGRLPLGVAAQSVPVLVADPASPMIGQIWYRQDTKQLSIRHNASTTVRVLLA